MDTSITHKVLRVITCLLLLGVLSACSGGGTGTNAPVGNNPVDPPGGSGGSGSTSCTLSAEEQEMLLAVNNARATTRSCGNTRFTATTPLAWSCRLKQAAAAHSADMADTNFFDHTGSDGMNAGDRITATGYRWRSWGENIAGGQSTAATAIDGWLNSPGHCGNIMDPGFAEMGIGGAFNSGSDFGTYWTQVFATPAN